MSDSNDGGPAFPNERWRPFPGGGGYRDDVPGMSLRDYFAGQALAGLLTEDGDAPPEEWAMAAYRLADAMIAARNEKP